MSRYSGDGSADLGDTERRQAGRLRGLTPSPLSLWVVFTQPWIAQNEGKLRRVDKKRVFLNYLKTSWIKREFGIQ